MQNQESGQDKEVGAAILRIRSEKASLLGGREVGGVSCQEEAGNVGVGPPRVSRGSVLQGCRRCLVEQAGLCAPESPAQRAVNRGT